MKHALTLNRLAVVAATTVISFHSGNAVSAGNMLLTISGFTAPIEILAFSTSVSRPSAGTGGAGTTVNFSDANFVAPESAALPKEYAAVTRAQNLTSAQLQVLSPVTSQLISDWTFTPARVTRTGISRDVAIGGSASTNFSLGFDKVVYRVYAADGTIAQQVCWGVGC